VEFNGYRGRGGGPGKMGWVWALVLLIGCATTAPAASPKRIVLLGDSTTYGYALDRPYGQILSEILIARGIPSLVINAGINGNTTDGGRTRFERDVLARKPDIVVIQYGLNDQGIRLYTNPAATGTLVAKEQFIENHRAFVRQLRERGITAILMTPNPMVWTPELGRKYPDGPYLTAPDGGNRRLERYVESIRAVAVEERVPLVDIYRIYSTRNSLDDLFLPDGVHPNEKAYGINADALAEVLAPARANGPAPAGRSTRALDLISRGRILALSTRGRGWREDQGRVVLERIEERGNPLDRITLPVALGSGDFQTRARVRIFGAESSPLLIVGNRRFALGAPTAGGAGPVPLVVAVGRPITLEIARRKGVLTVTADGRRLFAEETDGAALPVLGFEPGKGKLEIYDLRVELSQPGRAAGE
jgi:lysophospholipase L1-like esterase